MKRNLLFLLMTLLLCIGSSAFNDVKAQTTESIVTIDGTIGGHSATTSQYVPLWNYENYTISQIFYTKDEIGKSNGDKITKIAFKVANVDAAAYERDIDIYMVNCGDEYNFGVGGRSTKTIDANTKVYSGDFTYETSQKNTWITITLNTPFTYEGGNILICVNDYTNDYVSSGCAYFDAFNCNYTLPYGNDTGLAYRAIYQGNHNSNSTKYDPTSGTIFARQSTPVPFIQFTFEEQQQDPITLVPSLSENITTCDNVTFTVTQGEGTDNDVTTECIVYQKNGTEPATELPDKTFTPKAAGEYTFYAMKGSVKSNNEIIIRVTEAAFELKASATTVVVNNDVVFSVERCGEVVEGFTFYVDGEEIGGNTFTPTETGDYSVKAMKGTEAETQSITIKVIEESEWKFTGNWVTDDLFAKKVYDYENIVEITNDSCTLWMAITRTGDKYDNGIILNNNVELYGDGANESYNPRSGHRPKTPQPLSIPETIYVENIGEVTITEIANNVFYDQFDNTGAGALGNSSNVNISDITLPKTITKIGVNAFSFNTATNAQKVYITCKATKVPEIKESTFSNNVYQKYTLLLPASSFESYKEDPYWKKFFNYNNTPEIDPESILIFTGDGDWTDEKNWNIYPTESDMVTINGNVEITTDITVNGMTINSGYKVNVMEDGVLTVNGDITKEENSDIVIEDGGQLYYNSTGEIEVTMKKAIKGYGDVDNKDGWYTISSPVYSVEDMETYGDAPYYYVAINDVTNLIPTNPNHYYDLYRYYEYGEAGEEGWWENHKKGDEQLDETLDDTFPGFDILSNGQGYLYASSNDVTLEFTGKVITDSIIHHCYRMNTNEDFKGFNLIGNPYTHNITGKHLTNLEIAEGFYTVDNAGTWTTHLLTETIKPAQGMLVKVTDPSLEDIGFIKIVEDVKDVEETSRNRSTNKSFSIDITNEKFSDRAFVSFSEGHGLNKYPHLNKEAHEVYIPVDGVDYAVATMNEDVKEIPISFEAKTFGQYTIGVKTQDCDFNTMTLIDKLTGNETNLLTDTYTFFARTTDNPNRFVLTLSSDTDTDSDFIYINNGEMIINNIEGNGHIVVYDIMGRPMAEYNVSGSANISIESFANGVYIVRMTDDNGVKTQKIIRN